MILLTIIRAIRAARRLDHPDMVRMRAQAAAAVKACLEEEEGKW